MSATGALKWKDLLETQMPEQLQTGPTLAVPRAFVPDHGPINSATLNPPTEPSMLRTEGSIIRWQNVANILIVAGIVIFLLSLN